MNRLFIYLTLVFLIFNFHIDLLLPTYAVGRRGSMLTAVMLGSVGIWANEWLEILSEIKDGQPIPAVVFAFFRWGILLFSLVIGFLV